MRLHLFLAFLICWSGLGASLYSEAPGNYSAGKPALITYAYAITASSDITPGIAYPALHKDQLPGQQKFYKASELKHAHAPGRDRFPGAAILPQLFNQQLTTARYYRHLLVPVKSDVHSLIRLLLYPKHSFW
jgi:hypothetical protein